jgi:heme-degrading monooxygenase HmoA
MASLIKAYGRPPDSHYNAYPGFMGALLLVDKANGRARSITIWRDQADFAAAAKSEEYAAAMKQLGAHFTAAPNLETWELAALTGLSSASSTVSCDIQRALGLKHPDGSNCDE